MREEQLATHPRFKDCVPDLNPRGCQKGAVHSDAMYNRDRIRFPMKRIGYRGTGKWRRLSWDQALTEIADKIIDINRARGPAGCWPNKGLACSPISAQWLGFAS